MQMKMLSFRNAKNIPREGKSPILAGIVGAKRGKEKKTLEKCLECQANTSY